MHTAIHFRSKCPHDSPWKNAEPLRQRKPPGPYSFNVRPKTLRPRQKREALKIPSGYPIGWREKKEEEEEEAGSTWLSIRIHKGDRSYVVDGNRLREVGVDHDGLSFNGLDDFTRFLRRWVGISLSALRKFFIPQKVGPSYMDYLRWKFVHRIFSSTLQVLATQAMFRAIGLGSSRSLPSAAAFNWVLKNGLGRLSRCIYTASIGSAFDTNLKHFLLLAAIANIAKSISLAAYIATSSAIHRSFAIADNLGEISAKAQIQTVCFDNLGLMLAAVLNLLCENHQRRLQTGFPLVIYPLFAALDLYAIAQGLKHIHLQTLTKDRLDIIIERWIQSGLMPSPAEVSLEEDSIIWSKGSKQWRIRIGCVDPKDRSVKFLQPTLQSLRTNDMYFICWETTKGGLARKHQDRLLLCLHQRACTADILRGMLEACHIREALSLRRTKTLLGATSVRSRDQSAQITCSGGPQDLEFDISTNDWFEMVEESRKLAEGNTGLLTEEMMKSGWTVKNVLLNSQEQVRFSLEV